MDWQQPASLAIVVIAAALLARHELRSRRRAKLSACGSDCGCTTRNEGESSGATHSHSRLGNRRGSREEQEPGP